MKFERPECVYSQSDLESVVRMKEGRTGFLIINGIFIASFAILAGVMSLVDHNPDAGIAFGSLGLSAALAMNAVNFSRVSEAWKISKRQISDFRSRRRIARKSN